MRDEYDFSKAKKNPHAKPDGDHNKFSFKKSLQSTNLMPKSLKNETNKLGIALIIFLALLPIVIGLISFLVRN